MQWHKAFLWKKIFFTAVYNHAGGSCQSDTLVQTWERSSNLLSHLHTADPEQCEVSVNVGLSVSEKNNFVKVLDKSNLFQKLQRSCVNVIVTSFLGFLFQTKFGRKIGPGLSPRLLVHPIAQQLMAFWQNKTGSKLNVWLYHWEGDVMWRLWVLWCEYWELVHQDKQQTHSGQVPSNHWPEKEGTVRWNK